MEQKNKQELIPVSSVERAVATNIQQAKQLKKYIIDNKKGLVKNGKRYIEFTEWQTLANPYEVTVHTEVMGEVVIHGDKGMKAFGRAIHIPTGNEVGYAEAMAFRSEPGKHNQSWNQIGSLAQTRAGAKALKNAMGWIVELAGIESTPAEEMEGINETQKEKTKKEKKKKDTKQKRKKMVNVETEQEDPMPGIKHKTKPKPEDQIPDDISKDEIIDAEIEPVSEDEKLPKKEKQAGLETSRFKDIDGQGIVTIVRSIIRDRGDEDTSATIKMDVFKLKKAKQITPGQERQALSYLKSIT